MPAREKLNPAETDGRANNSRPEYVPSETDRKWVQFANAMGATKLSMLAILKIDEKTFDKHFKLEHEEGKVQWGLRVTEEVVRRAFGYWEDILVQKRRKGKPVFWGKGARDNEGNDIEGEPKMVKAKRWVAGDNNLLLRLFNAWVSNEKNQTQFLGKNGKPVDPPGSAPMYTTVHLPPNGRETGANGDPRHGIKQQMEFLANQLKEMDTKGKRPN